MKNDDKEKIMASIGANMGFKTVFKATLGFYAAQFIATLIGLAVFGLVIFAIGIAIMVLK
jgi:hypothetical protein